MGFKMWQIGEGENCPCCGSTQACGCTFNCLNNKCDFPKADLNMTLMGSGTNAQTQCVFLGFINGPESPAWESTPIDPMSIDVLLSYDGQSSYGYPLGSFDSALPSWSGAFNINCNGGNWSLQPPNDGGYDVATKGSFVLIDNNCSGLIYRIVPPIEVEGRCSFTISEPTHIFQLARIDLTNAIHNSGYCVQFCVISCNKSAPGSTIIVSNSGGTYQGITNVNGCVSIDIKNGGNYNIEVDAPGMNPLFDFKTLLCQHTYSYSFGCTYGACVSDCNRQGVEGVSIEVEGGGVGGSTDSTGCWMSPCISYPKEGETYTIIASYNGTSAQSPAGCGVPSRFSVVKYCVYGCNGLPLPGANITINGKGYTTGQDGCMDQGVLLQPGQVPVITVTAPKFLPYPQAGFPIGGCGIIMQPDDDHICCGGGYNPISKVLQLTDSVLGQCNLIFSGGYPGVESPGSWGGYIIANYQGKCGCPPCPVIVLYYMNCTGNVPSIVVWVVGAQDFSDVGCQLCAGPDLCPGGATPPNASLIPMFPWPLSSVSYDPLDASFQNQLGCVKGCYGGCDIGEGPFSCGCDNGENLPSYAINTVWADSLTTATITITDNS